MTTEEIGLWYVLLERTMFQAIRGTRVAAKDDAEPVLNKKDCNLIKSDRSLPTEEIREALDTIEHGPGVNWEPLSRSVTLRLAFRAYLARELWDLAFKNESVRAIGPLRECLEAQGIPEIKEAKRGLLLEVYQIELNLCRILPGIVSDTFFMEKADRFIEVWPLLVRNAGRNSAEET